MDKKKSNRIVILGGGFAGIYTAMHLEKLLGRRNDFEILLLNKENYFVFQPMLAEVVTHTLALTGDGKRRSSWTRSCTRTSSNQTVPSHSSTPAWATRHTRWTCSKKACRRETIL